ncbi:hypothetical protein P9112_000845 [Eukaryota sp. TZLM1-RC]
MYQGSNYIQQEPANDFSRREATSPGDLSQTILVDSTTSPSSLSLQTTSSQTDNTTSTSFYLEQLLMSYHDNDAAPKQKQPSQLEQQLMIANSTLMNELHSHQTIISSLKKQINSLTRQANRTEKPSERSKVLEVSSSSSFNNQHHELKREITILKGQLRQQATTIQNLTRTADFCKENHANNESRFAKYISLLESMSTLTSKANDSQCRCSTCMHLRGEAEASGLIDNRSVSRFNFERVLPKFKQGVKFEGNYNGPFLLSTRWKSGSKKDVLPIGRHSSLS